MQKDYNKIMASFCGSEFHDKLHYYLLLFTNPYLYLKYDTAFSGADM